MKSKLSKKKVFVFKNKNNELKKDSSTDPTITSTVTITTIKTF